MRFEFVAVAIVAGWALLGCRADGPAVQCTDNDDCAPGERCAQPSPGSVGTCVAGDAALNGGDGFRGDGGTTNGGDLAAPSGVTATSGESPAHVTVDWNESVGAREYEVLRDGEAVATVAEPPYEDEGADPSGAPKAPSVSATQGDHVDRVVVSWNTPDVPPGTTHTYRVVAIGDGGRSEKSASADGHRSAQPVSGYEVRVDGGEWRDVGETTSWEDESPKPPEFSFGTVDATDGEFVDRVELTVDGASAEGEPSTYEVRASNEVGPGETSNAAEGFTDAGEVSLQWQRSSANSDADYTDIQGATSKNAEDVGLPDDGSWRYYRVRGSLPGGESATSDADRGRTLRKRPVAGDGAEIFVHDFADGMPADFEHSADYPNSGTWGRVHEIASPNPEGVFEPASIDGEHLALADDRCSSEGTAYPTNVSKGREDWELFYRVDARPDDDGHSNRMIGGIGCVGCEPAGDYSDDRSQLGRGRTGFVGINSDETDAFELQGWDASGDTVTESQPTGGKAIDQGEWYVRIATSTRLTKTWVKYWKADQSEPGDWTHTFEGVHLSGRPGFYIKTSCKSSSEHRANYYRFYELREVGL